MAENLQMNADRFSGFADVYDSIGFAETGIKLFPHLPFSVCYMERTVQFNVNGGI